MKIFGLIGFPLSHSFSKKYFSDKFEKAGILDSSYELYPLSDISKFPDLIQEVRELKGLNVTIPYKVQILSYLDKLDPAAELIGAVNCISLNYSNHSDRPILVGHNTDAYGFQASLLPLIQEHHKKALILGDGGAAQAVKYSLDLLNIPFTIVTRKPQVNSILYTQVDHKIIDEHHIIINTTPVGMYPDLDTAPELPYECLTAQHLAYDLIYNPAITCFLRKSELAGAQIKNGLEMLELQAEKAWEIWNLANEKV